MLKYDLFEKTKNGTETEKQMYNKYIFINNYRRKQKVQEEAMKKKEESTQLSFDMLEMQKQSNENIERNVITKNINSKNSMPQNSNLRNPNQKAKNLLNFVDDYVLVDIETTGLSPINDRIEKIKKDAVLINVGRGSAIDTEALCDALENGHLRGAALDVTDPEPLPPHHRLWRLPNAIITPHISGGYTVMKTYDRIIEICLKNFSRFLNGEELFNLVDFKTGYRVTQK